MKRFFTPATKAESGHDENIGFEDFRAIVGGVADQLRDLTIAVYEFGRDYAKERGIILADTKFEFGYVNGEITLIDEILTPDSSRFWDVREYQVGMSPPSFDKQIVRNHLIATGWDREPPIPSLPRRNHRAHRRPLPRSPGAARWMTGQHFRVRG